MNKHIKKLIKETREAQKQKAAICSNINTNIVTLDRLLLRIFKERWKKAFGDIPVKCLSLLNYGSHVADWKPTLHIYNINNLAWTTRGWAPVRQHVYDSDRYYDDCKFVAAPVSQIELAKFRKEFKREYGVDITITKKKVVSAKLREELSKPPCSIFD